MDGGVSEPLVGVGPLLPSLEVSVERSVLKLALDRLLSSLKFGRKDGAMAAPTKESLECPWAVLAVEYLQKSERIAHWGRETERYQLLSYLAYASHMGSRQCYYTGVTAGTVGGQCKAQRMFGWKQSWRGR